MRKLSFLLLAAILPFANLNAQQAAHPHGGPIIVALPDTLNLGEIYLDELSNEIGKVQLKIRNDGNSPLILNKVSGCCGTNIKQWTKAPILPDKEGTIDVEFHPDYKPQTINRKVTVESNATNDKKKVIHIVGIITERKSANEIEL